MKNDFEIQKLIETIKDERIEINQGCISIDEMCGECGKEFTKTINIVRDGIETTCPHCNSRITICSICNYRHGCTKCKMKY